MGKRLLSVTLAWAEPGDIGADAPGGAARVLGNWVAADVAAIIEALVANATEGLLSHAWQGCSGQRYDAGRIIYGFIG